MTHRIPELAEREITSRGFSEPARRHAPHTVIPEASSEGVRFERLLVPVDLSTGSLAVLRRARALMRPGGMIRVLHAVHLNVLGEERGIARTGLIRELHAAARQELTKLIESLWAEEAPAAVIVREGRARDVILNEALETNADLIVMGAHQHGGWSRIFHANTAAHVMRHAPCPVLVVHP